MSWRAIAVTDVQNRFTPAELAMLQAAQNSLTQLQATITDIVNETVSALQGAGYPVTAGQVPDILRRRVIAGIVWEWLTYFPKLAVFKTEERKVAGADYAKAISAIGLREFGAIEAPYGTDITTGSWNSEQKLIMRTHPTPPAGLQFPVGTLNAPNYANPNAPTDNVPTTSPGLPAIPLNLQADGQAGQIILSWEPALNAATYNLYRGVLSQQELATPIASGLTVTNFADTNLPASTTYYYKVRSVAAANGLTSDLSTEAAGTTAVAPP